MAIGSRKVGLRTQTGYLMFMKGVIQGDELPACAFARHRRLADGAGTSNAVA
jgi:hypothetical protein